MPSSLSLLCRSDTTGFKGRQSLYQCDAHVQTPADYFLPLNVRTSENKMCFFFFSIRIFQIRVDKQVLIIYIAASQ